MKVYVVLSQIIGNGSMFFEKVLMMTIGQTYRPADGMICRDS